jgi:hypothetical protein
MSIDDYTVRTDPIEPKTMVFDLARQREVILLDGILPLPVGSVIELFDQEGSRHADAVVTAVRLLASNHARPRRVGPRWFGAQLCLDCEVEARWWDNR